MRQKKSIDEIKAIKLAQLEAELEAETKAEQIAQIIDYDVTALSGGQLFIANLENLDQLRDAISKIKPTNEIFEINQCGSNSGVWRTPYKVDISNNIRDIDLSVKFDIEQGKLWLRIPLKGSLEGFTVEGSRGVVDTEMHYYGGFSRQQVGRIRIRTENFNTDKVLRWYGGDQTLIDIPMINKLLDV